VLWTAQSVSELSSYAGHLFLVIALWMFMVRMTASVGMQVLLKACFHAEMPLRTVNIKSHNCFAWVGLPEWVFTTEAFARSDFARSRLEVAS